MKSIYILLTRSDTILSKIVHFITSDTYTHVSISFEENLQSLYSSSRKNGRTLFPAGPCAENLQSEYYKKHSQIPCAVYELQVNNEVYENAMIEVEKIISNSDCYHFNILGLLLCQFHIPYHREHHFFCSEFVSEVLHRSHALDLPKDTSLMRPNDYTAMPEICCLFQGHLWELTKEKNQILA